MGNIINSAITGTTGLQARALSSAFGEDTETGRALNKIADPLGLESNSAETANNELLQAFDGIQGRRNLTDAQGNLLPQFRTAGVGAENVARGNRALNRLEGLTNFGEATPIAQRLLEVQNTANRQAINNIAGQQAGQLQAGISSLARQGGVSSGARERLASNAFNQGLLANQRQAASDQAARQQINANDAQRQLGILQSLPGQQQSFAAFQRSGATADRNLAAQDFLAANQEAQQRQAARAEALINARAQENENGGGGLKGIVSGIFGG